MTLRPRPPALHEDVIEEDSVSRSWAYNSLTGSLQHKSGMRFSPNNGIQCDGREYKLTADDIEIDEEGLLGVGASGTVWCGRIKSCGTPVAIKSLKVNNSDERKLLLNEVRTLIEAEGCPHLVQWHAGFASQHGGQVNLILELMDRGSLASLKITPGTMPPNMLAAISLQVLRGLDHLHSRRLLHNDIKPGNILVNQFGDVKVTDFGITAPLESSFCDACRGTQTYIAPEKVEASMKGAGYSYPSDIWSFGIVCYELIAGVHPFARAATIPDLFQLLLDSPEPRLDEACGYPAALCNFIEMCLNRDPAQRATAQELLAHNFIADAASQKELSEWLASLGQRDVSERILR